MKPIRKLLVANRGEIASRVIRACRAMGIRSVAVYSEADCHAPFVGEADEAVALGGASAAESYLRVDTLLEAAVRTGADAVHPGYGFLAENARFASRCAEAGLVFVGPSPEAIAEMGMKSAAKQLMKAAGVPVLPGMEVSDTSPPALQAAAARIGFPLLVKAVAGGGGRGMRIARSADELESAVEAAAREAAAAFGDPRLLLERYLDAPRHVEVQIFGDSRGQLVSLFERECSIQRRYQKIIEESPSPAVDSRLREALGAAAVTAGRAIGYIGAGTVEFLLTREREFFFLEMNTRLQVEHAVTECVTGLDLVRLQILVAQGEMLPGEVTRASLTGHAIEARLYAEDAERDYLPSSGTLRRFAVPPVPGVRVDSGVADGSQVSTHYDPLLAKLVAHAPTRNEAAARLALALERMQVHGLVTNRELLVGILRAPEFLAGATDTHFLMRHSPVTLCAPERRAEVERTHAVAAALAGAGERRALAPVLQSLPAGWRNHASGLSETLLVGRSGRLAISYRLAPLQVRVNGEELPARLHANSPTNVDLELGGIRRRYAVSHEGENWDVDSALGHSALREPTDAATGSEPAGGSLLAPLPGRVIRLAVAAGTRVEKGALLALVEAMKMEHPVLAPHAGVVREVLVREGQTLEAGTLLLVLDAE